MLDRTKLLATNSQMAFFGASNTKVILEYGNNLHQHGKHSARLIGESPGRSYIPDFVSGLSFYKFDIRLPRRLKALSNGNVVYKIHDIP